MALIKWNDKLSVNIEHIDKQHKLLVDYINELDNSLNTITSREDTTKLITKLIIYAAMHFAKEEDYFDRYNYPDSEMHKKLHIDFEDKMTEFEDDFKAGKAELSEDILKFLKDWLINHILGTDKKYSDFLLKKGVR